MLTVEHLLKAWRALNAEAAEAEMVVRRAFEDQLSGHVGPSEEMIRNALRLREAATAALSRLTGSLDG